MKILKEGTPWEYKMKCDECFCEFSFINKDFTYSYTKEKEALYCPCCGKLIYFNKKDYLYKATATIPSGISSLT